MEIYIYGILMFHEIYFVVNFVHIIFRNDLVFLRGLSCVATAGESTNNYNVCIWDILFKQ